MSQKKNIVTFSLLAKFPNVTHGISTRSFGSIKEKGVIFEKNLASFAKALKVDKNSIVFTKQVHGAKALMVTSTQPHIAGEADSLVTRKKGVIIGMGTADCLPIIFYDPQKECIAVVHAGYKGILAGVIEMTIDQMKKIGSKPKEIVAGIGPGIGVCCYDVDANRVATFKKKYGISKVFYKIKNGKQYLDLQKIAHKILLHEGIKNEHTEVLSLCTSCHNDQFFSYRKDSKKTFGEFVTVAGII